jgi:DsbC/DsbD-like thiol-disulfide interchange protein
MRHVMITPTRRACLVSVSGLGAACLLSMRAGPVQAQQEASGWAKSSQSSLRLVAGGAGADGRLRAGVEIRLGPGYKTYWRNPGDSGIPPRFDWSASENLGGVEVRWPVPARFSDGAGSSIGYLGDVLFPLLVTPLDPARPVALRLSLDYAVCERLCIPVHGKAELALGAATTRHSPQIARAEALVPLRIPMGTNTGIGTALLPSLLEARAIVSNGKAFVHLRGAAPPGRAVAEVMVEGPDMWVFGSPLITSEQGGTWRAVIALEDRPPQQGGRIPLVVTLVTPENAAELALDLDIPVATP